MENIQFNFFSTACFASWFYIQDINLGMGFFKMLYFLLKYNQIFKLFPVETHVQFLNNQQIWSPKIDSGLLNYSFEGN